MPRTEGSSLLLRARLVLPLTAPPLEDGAVLISGARLEWVGKWSDAGARRDEAPVLDLGEVILLPGLVNAHCHLDFTGFAGKVAPPRSFTDWIQGVLAIKAQWSFTDYAASWLAGARQLLESGCTSVLDHESVPELLPEVWSGTPLRVLSALELTGVRAGSDPERLLAETLARVDALPPHGRSRVVLAPHAPYSTRPDLPRRCAEVARARGWPISMHVAESAEEFDMFRHGTGRMFHWLQAQRDMSDCGLGTPLEAVARAGLLGANAVVVHANYLEDADIVRLAETRTTVVHCPRSHEYFGHAPFPMERLLQAGVRVALGTDSLLTVRKSGRVVPRLDFSAELRAAVEAFPGLPPQRVLSMATVDAAHALGRGTEVGRLEATWDADLITVPYSGSRGEATDFVVRRTERVMDVMIGGRWVLGRHATPGTPPEPCRP